MIEKLKNSIVAIIIVAVVVFGMIFYRSYQNRGTELKAVKSELSQVNRECDSIKALPPKITVVENIVKGEEVHDFKFYKDSLRNAIVDSISQARYDAIERSYTSYKDSIKNDSIDINWTVKAKDLFSIDAVYRPIYKYKETTIEKKVPYPVKIPYEVQVNTRGLFFNAGLGYGDNVAAKAGLMYLTRKGNTLNYDLLLHSGSTIHTFSYGIKF